MMAKAKAKVKGKIIEANKRSVKTMDRWMYWVYLALLVLVPLAFSRTPLEWINSNLRGLTFDQFDIAKVVTMRFLTLVIFGLWALKVFKAREAKVRYTAFDIAIIAFLLFAAVSTILSIHYPTSLNGKFKRYEGLLTFINYGMLYFLALQTFYSERRVAWLAKVMAVTGGVVALYGLAQFAGLDLFQWAELPFEKHRSFATYGNPDLLAGYLVIVLPFSIACLLASKDKREIGLFSVTTALIFVNVVASLVRGAWIATVIIFAIFLVCVIAGYAAKRLDRSSLTRIGAIVGVFFVVCAATTVFSSRLGEPNLNIIARVKSMTKLDEGSIGSRFQIWTAGISMIKSRPLFGLGPDTYRLGSERYETEKYVKGGAGRTVSDNAHNYIIQLAAGPGTLATAAFLVFVGAVFALSLPALRRQSKERLIMTMGLFAAGVGYFVHLFSGVSVTGSTALFWVVLGALAGQTAAVKDKSFDPSELLNKAIVGVVALVAAVSFFYSAKMFTGDYYYAQGLMTSTADAGAAIDYYKSAISLYSNGRYYDSLGQFYLQLYQVNKDPSYLDQAVAVLEEGVKFEPLEADHKVFLANAYLTEATPENLKKGRDILDKTLEVRPRSVSAFYLLAEINRLEKKSDEAIRCYKEVLKYTPSDGTAYMGMGRTYETMGDKRQALDAYRSVVAIQPDNKWAVEAIKRLQ